MHQGISAGLQFYRAGRQAARDFPELRKRMRKAFLLSLLVLTLCTALVMGLVFALLLAPLELWVTEHLPNWADWIIRAIVAVVSITAAFLTLALSLRFTVVVLGFWFESAVAPLVAHYNPEAQPGHGGPSLLLEVFREIGLFIGLFLLEFIPVVGWILVLLLSTWLIGLSVHAPHKAVLRDRALTRTRPAFLDCLSAGTAEMLLLPIPLLGWILLPWVMIHMVVGQASLYEQNR